jgi:DNA-binding PadR family transcriptional regulator
MAKTSTKTPTTPDLVLLSLLSEQAMHGYQANLELERRCIRDWAAISRPQVYYSLEKLARQGLIRAASDSADAAGPERCVYTTTPKGLAALSAALSAERWTTERDRPPFLTWLALSWRLPVETVRQQVERRRKYLQRELARERATLRGVKKEVGHSYHEAVWMITLGIAQLRTELVWLRKLSREVPWRAPAQRPQIISGQE